MRLTAKTDLEAPVEYLYACLADQATWERDAIRNGVEIERPVDMPLTGKGAGWIVRLPFRGRVRTVKLTIADMVDGESLSYAFDGEALAGSAVLETRALSPRRSRLRVAVEAKPKTLAARLFLNTLRLARRKVEDRLERRVAQLGARIEERYARDRR